MYRTESIYYHTIIEIYQEALSWVSFIIYKNFFEFINNLKLFIIYKSSYKYKKEMREMVYYEKEFIKNVIDWMYGC
ncbi:hypothetical protein CNEO2_2670004 [Clostridium neonatale]|nr:hypothetical protein CNEO2_2670004 [Clostridium neonatale]